MFTVDEITPIFFLLVGMFISTCGELFFALGQFIREKVIELHRKNEKEN